MKPIKLTNTDNNLLNNTQKQQPNTQSEKLNVDISKFIQEISKKASDKIETYYNNNDKLSDKEALDINRVGSLSNDLENNLTEEEFEYVTKYYQGKTLNDIVDEKGNLKKISRYDDTLSQDEVDKINNKITNISFDLHETYKDFAIEEIYKDETGFNAVVLKDTTGNYIICASSTNEKSGKDISAISYTLIDYLYDDELAKYLPYTIARNFEDNPSEYSINAEEDYKNQIESCYKLIEKYTKKAKDEGKKINLSGYSLGGGITTTAYALMKIKNPELTEQIDSINVYNPYLLYANSYNEKYNYSNYDPDKGSLNKNIFGLSLIMNGMPILGLLQIYTQNFNSGIIITGNTIIDTIKNDPKLTIYSAEYDVVSTFNNYITKLKDRIVYVPAPEIDIEKLMLKQEKFDPEKELSIINNNSLSLYNFIIAGIGNHGFCYSNEIFDKKGNIIKEGSYKNINETFAKLVNKKYNKNTQKPDLQFLMKSSLNGILALPVPLEWLLEVASPEMLKEYNINLKLGEIDISCIDYIKIIEYLYKNPGNFDKKEFISVVSKAFYNKEFLTQILSDAILKNQKEIGATIKEPLKFILKLYCPEQYTKEHWEKIINEFNWEDSFNSSMMYNEIINYLVEYMIKDEKFINIINETITEKYDETLESIFLIINNNPEAGIEILIEEVGPTLLNKILDQSFDKIDSFEELSFIEKAKTIYDFANNSNSFLKGLCEICEKHIGTIYTDSALGSPDYPDLPFNTI